MRGSVLFTIVCLSACEAVVGNLGGADQLPTLNTPGPDITKFDCSPLAGEAPLDITCVLTVSSPKAVSCQVDPGGGMMTMQIDDCLTTQTVTLTLTNEGQYVVKATATDSEYVANDATVAVVVQPTSDHAPVVGSFKPTSNNGGAPMSTTLTWSVSDPDNDMLTCKLNDVVVDCNAGSAPWMVSAPGSQTVTLTVTDPKGKSATQSVVLTARMPVGDLKISKVEWGQTIVSDNPRLVAGKGALLRVYVISDTANLSGFKVQATGKNGSKDLGTIDLHGPGTAPMMDDPTDLTQQFTGDVPAEWISSGFTVDVKVDTDDAIPETNELNNLSHLAPTVGLGNVMHLTPVSVIQPSGPTGTVVDVAAELQRVWPLKEVEVKTRAPYNASSDLTAFDFDVWAQVRDEVGAVRAMDNSARSYYGFVRVNWTQGILGIAQIGDGYAIGVDPSNLGLDEALQTNQHELGHTMGRYHAPCGGAGGPDPSYPYAGAKIGSWGYDAKLKQLMQPMGFVDLMSYCSPVWVSDYNYSAVQQALEGSPSFVDGAVAYVKTMVVTGRIGDHGNLLKPVYRVTSRFDTQAAAKAAPTGRMLRARFADGRERIVHLTTHETAELPWRERTFTAQIEDLGPLSKLELVEGGQTLASHVPTRMPEPPRFDVRRISPNVVSLTWDASRWSHAALAHLGAERTTLALDMTGGSRLVHVDGLPAGGRFEVSLSDGPDSVSALVGVP
jgi:hypothetical protein